eukprot:CFRG7606T1
MDNIALRQQTALNHLMHATGCKPEEAKQLLEKSNWQFEIAVSRFYGEVVPDQSLRAKPFPAFTPANTPASPSGLQEAMSALQNMNVEKSDSTCRKNRQ